VTYKSLRKSVSKKNINGRVIQHSPNWGSLNKYYRRPN
jgi:hypothetical protein